MERYKIQFLMYIAKEDRWVSACMDGFGKGFNMGEAAALKAHLEGSKDHKDVVIVALKEGAT